MKKLVFLLLAFFVAAQSCGSEGDYIRSTKFEGIEGKILRVESSCPDIGCMCGNDDGEVHPDGGAIIEALIDGNSAGRVFADFRGEFSLPLSHGTYNIVIYPTEAYIDDEIRDVVISTGQGMRIRRTYNSYFRPWQLHVTFVEDLPHVRGYEILEENGLRVIYTYGRSFFAETPHTLHVQEVQKILEENYEEVDYTSIEYYQCLAD